MFWQMLSWRVPGMYYCAHGANAHTEKRDFSSRLTVLRTRWFDSNWVQAVFLVPVNRRAPFFQDLQQHAAASLEVEADRDGMFANTQG